MRKEIKNNIVLLEQSNGFSRKIAKKYHSVYLYCGNLENAKKIPGDMLDQIDFHFAHYKAGQEIDWVYSQYVKCPEEEVLNSVIKDKRAHLIIKKNILKSLGALFYSFILAGKFIKRYGIKEPVDFIPSPFLYSIYKIISTKNGLFSKNVRIPEEYIRAMKHEEVFKNILYKAKLILYPLWILSRMNVKKEISIPPKKYRFGVHIWDSWISSVTVPYHMDFLEGTDFMNQENTLYIIDGHVSKSNLLKAKSNGYGCCCFKEMISDYPASKYIKMMLWPHLKLCVKSFLTSRKISYILIESFLRLIQGYIHWEIFYSKYSVDNFITLQEPGNIARALIQQGHGSKCIFVFWSTSYDPVYQENMENHFDCYYSYMVFDTAVSSLVSNEYLKKNNNFIDKYVNVGILRSDIVYKMKQDEQAKIDLRKKFGISLDKKLIGFFDTNIGRKGVFTNDEGSRMFDDMRRLLESNKEYFIVYRSRLNPHQLENSDLRKALNKLKEHNRLIYINELPVLYYAFEIMGACDLVIGTFFASAPLESVSGGVPTLCYIPDRFNKDFFDVNNFPNFSVHGYDDLQKYTRFWLKEGGGKEFSDFQDRYIKKYIDNYCDGKAVNRLHLLLQNYN